MENLNFNNLNKIEIGAVSREIQDRLFKAIFGRDNPQSKKWRLELYNALSGKNYTDPDSLEVNTIENVIYFTMRNDISFLVDSQMTLLEQQSTCNPNMPLRGLMYFAQLYQMHLSKLGKTLLRSSLVRIPTPQFIVFYNGEKKTKDVEYLKLSDAFEIPDTSGQFEWTAKMININSEHNITLQKKCKPLYDYIRLISEIKRNKKNGLSAKDAVSKSVEWAIEEKMLDGFFKTQKEEVLAMSLTEFNAEEVFNDILAEGIEQGAQQKAIEGAKNLYANGVSVEIIAKSLKMTIEEVMEIIKQ